MTKQTALLRQGLLGLTAFAMLWATAAFAQDIDKFIISPEAAKKTLNRYEVNAETAEKIANACQDFAKAHNVAVTVFILSPDGEIVYARRMDGQNPINIETGLLKAKTVLYMRTSSHTAANRFDTELARTTRTNLPVYFVSGGLPIMVGDQMIGAIGVGGSNVDEQCAYEALTKVVGPQPPLAQDKPKEGAPTR